MIRVDTETGELRVAREGVTPGSGVSDPVQRGFRFCAKASGPSFASSLAHRRSTPS